MKKIVGIVIAVVLAGTAGLAISHSGGLDRNGCHTDHSNGTYHCHR